MKTYRVTLTKRAKADIEAIHRYISEEFYAPKAADRLIDKLSQSILSLSIR